jgi:superfamily II DNA or RNA helicase
VSTRRELQDHQALVLKDWISNGHRGIIDHVTGAGKTVTALRAVEYWVREHGPAIILVPSELLFRQWKTEIEADLSALAPNLLEVGAGSSRRSWEKLTADFTRDAPGLGHRIVLATMQTAASEDFRKRVRDGAHLLIVADEVHRMGAKGLRSILELRAGATLGLSATPERFGDPEGSAAIAAFFGRILVPRFSIPDAIAAGRLVPYDYYVHKCSLSAEEQTEWDMLTTRIRRAYAQLPRDGAGRRVHTEQFLQLLIRRARILKQATSKVDTALAVITSHYRPGQRWLAYCDNQEQLSRLLASLRACGVPADEYHSAMIGSRADTFVHFSAVGGVLVAIKCLDEGVDIPAVDAAVILASSTNSREFIQRRGRVLRTAPGKHSAQIHDLLVVPARDETGQPDRSRATILRTELRRASEFASHARNRGVSLELEVLARQEQVDEFASTTDEYEEDDDA